MSLATDHGRSIPLAFNVLTVEWVWTVSEAGLFCPSPSPSQCPACPFREACRAW